MNGQICEIRISKLTHCISQSHLKFKGVHAPPFNPLHLNLYEGDKVVYITFLHYLHSSLEQRDKYYYYYLIF
jgi:hypothetical protein